MGVQVCLQRSLPLRIQLQGSKHSDSFATRWHLALQSSKDEMGKNTKRHLYLTHRIRMLFLCPVQLLLELHPHRRFQHSLQPVFVFLCSQQRCLLYLKFNFFTDLRWATRYYINQRMNKKDRQGRTSSAQGQGDTARTFARTSERASSSLPTLSVT